MPCQHMVLNFPGRWVRQAVPTSGSSNFVTLDRFGVTDARLSYFVSHVNIVRSSCRTRLAPRGLAPFTSVLGFEVLISPNVPNSFSFNGVTGSPGFLSLVLGPFKELPAD